ncbi:hypothetical protein H6503_05910 [Candidatus Woesearchaeota archaeon]|nr:hypothetical protein [Candidatus Woesearchaeota archaeon]
MIVQIGRYKFEKGSSKEVKKLCPLTLKDMTKDGERGSLSSKISIVVKKPDYGLIKVPRGEPIVERMLKLTNNSKDSSRSFVLLYVNNTFVGYKSLQSMKFIPGFNKKHYVSILDKYETKKKKKSTGKGYKAIKASPYMAF